MSEQEKEQKTVAITEEQLNEIKKDLEKKNDFLKDPYFRRWYPVWLHNSMENYHQIKKDFEKTNCCLTSFPKANRPAIILGGGPSLLDTMKYLKDWRHPILVSTSMAFNTVVEIDRDPDYISAFDSLHITAEQIGRYQWKNSTLLTHPNAEPETIKKWRWRKYYFRRVFPEQPFFDYVFPMMYPMIKLGIKFSGNVINNGISILNFMGYNPIYLVGADLGWWEHNRPRANSYVQAKNGTIELKPSHSSKHRKDILEFDNGFKTESSMLSFKDELLRITLSDKNMRIFDCSDGFVSELPKVDIKHVVEKQGHIDTEYNYDTIKENVDNYFKNDRPAIVEEFDKIFEKLKMEEEKKKNEKEKAGGTSSDTA